MKMELELVGFDNWIVLEHLLVSFLEKSSKLLQDLKMQKHEFENIYEIFQVI